MREKHANLRLTIRELAMTITALNEMVHRDHYKDAEPLLALCKELMNKTWPRTPPPAFRPATGPKKVALASNDAKASRSTR